MQSCNVWTVKKKNNCATYRSLGQFCPKWQPITIRKLVSLDPWTSGQATILYVIKIETTSFHNSSYFEEYVPLRVWATCDIPKKVDWNFLHFIKGDLN